MREGFMVEGDSGLDIGSGGDGGSVGCLPIKDDVNAGFPDGEALTPLDYG
jgi:hypothetical protein